MPNFNERMLWKCLLFIIPVDQMLRHPYHADVHRAPVFGQHGRLYLYSSAIGLERGMHVITRCGLMACSEQYPFLGVTVDDPQFTRKGVSCHPMPIVRACHVPEVVAIDLPLESELASAHIHYSQPCCISFSACRSPVFGVVGRLLLLRNLAMADDGKGQQERTKLFLSRFQEN